MKKQLTLIPLVLLLFACVKDKNLSNNIEGIWNATSYLVNQPGETSSRYNAINEENKSITFEFVPCELDQKEESACHIRTVNYKGYVEDRNFTYRILQNENLLLLYHTEEVHNEIWTITSANEEKLIMYKYDDTGAKISLELTKV